MDPSLAEAIGVNTEDLLLARPNCAENSLSAIDTLVKSGSVDVIVVDSVSMNIESYLGYSSELFPGYSLYYCV